MIPAHIFLIHGALADASSWSNVIPTLLAAGHNVTAVQQPLTSVSADIATVRDTLKGIINSASDVPIVVASHSFGGLTATNAVTDTPNIKGLVYISSFAPDEGESVGQLTANYPPLDSAKHLVSEGTGRLIFPQYDFVKYFAPDLDPHKAKVLAVTQGPFSPDRFSFVSGKPAWKQIKNIHYVISEKDQIVQPEIQAFFAQRLGAKTHTLRGASHAGLISQGEKVAEVILQAAHAC